MQIGAGQFFFMVSNVYGLMMMNPDEQARSQESTADLFQACSRFKKDMVSLGEELRRERELREISLREISEATKISIRILEAIENDNYQILPGGVFNRNFLRAYADFIGIDPEKIVRKYQIQMGGSGEDNSPLLEISTAGKEPEGSKKISGKVIVVSLIALIALLLLIFILKNSKFRPLINKISGSSGAQVTAPDRKNSFSGL
jgi:cytoskeletal protein RodZ